MKRKMTAIHEAGHSIIAHYSGLKVKRVFINEKGGRTETDDINNAKVNKCVAFIYIAISGIMAQTLYYGSSILYPDILKGNVDIDRLKEINLPKIWTKENLKNSMTGLQGFLSKPYIFGQIDGLADLIIDESKELKDVNMAIMRITRERTPEHDAGDLIKLLTNEIFGGRN